MNKENQEKLQRRLKAEEELMEKARKHQDWGTVRLCKEQIRKIKLLLK